MSPMTPLLEDIEILILKIGSFEYGIDVTNIVRIYNDSKDLESIIDPFPSSGFQSYPSIKRIVEIQVRGERVRMRVDEILGIHRFSSESLKPLPSYLKGIIGIECIVGIGIKSDDGLIMLIDPLRFRSICNSQEAP